VDSREDVERLVAGARKVEAAIRMHFISRLPGLKMSDLADDVSRLVAQFFLERQTEALHAAVTLASAAVATDDRLEALQNRGWAELRGGERPPCSQ
jgi:hypothetical protein